MEDALSLKYGLAGLCVLVTIMILVRVAEFALKMREKKEDVTDDSVKSLTLALHESTLAVRDLKTKVETLERAIGDLPKFRTDMRRFYAGLKEVAGKDKWPAVRDEIMKDDFNL